MEFHEKLQTLRKQKGLTQEQLAADLFVSRTAISKWESGRGYPGIDSLKQLSKYFSVSIDDLLSGEELLTAAEEETRSDRRRFTHIMFAALDAGALLFLFLPLFRLQTENAILPVLLISAAPQSPVIRAAWLALVGAQLACGLAGLLPFVRNTDVWEKLSFRLSLGLHAAAVLLFILTLQPYAAALSFFLLAIKAALLIRSEAGK